MNRIIKTVRTTSARKANAVVKAMASVSLAAALLLVAASCKKDSPEQGPIHVTKGETVLFRSAIGGSESGTKTAYSGVRDKEKPEIAESILWQTGDEIRIWCAECSEPTTASYGGADHWADYTVTPDAENGSSSAKIATHTGTVGLRWSEAETMPTHYFYAVSPSPRTSEKGETWSLGESSTGTPTPFTFTGIIPAAQAISGSLTETSSTEKDKTVKTTIAAPDMKNLYMVSKAEAKPVTETGTKAGEENSVFLNFRPLSTAIEFTIENAMTADDAWMQVESVKIMSDPKPESGNTAKNLAGAFIVDLAKEWTIPADVTAPAQSGIIGTYINKYPTCTEPADKSGQSSELTINFKNTIAHDPGIAKGDRLQFTFFLLPTQNVDDLSFVITRKDGEGTKTIKTRLEMADGTGIPFPVHKKTYVKGILVPDSAQWTIQYTVDVTAWDDDPEDLKFYYPDASEVTTVTKWTDVPCDPGFAKE